MNYISGKISRNGPFRASKRILFSSLDGMGIVLFENPNTSIGRSFERFPILCFFIHRFCLGRKRIQSFLIPIPQAVYNHRMSSVKKPTHRIRWFSIFLSLASALALAYLLWPIPPQQTFFTVESNQLQRAYRLEVQYPAWAVEGEPSQITARLSALNPDVAEVPATMGAMQLISEGLNFDPEGVISSPFPKSKTVSYSWTTTPARAGEMRFTLFYSRQSLDAASKTLVEQPVWAKSFPLTVRAGLGNWKNPTVFFAGCGLFLGILLLLFSGMPRRRGTT
jgi:hypothetical protein